MILVSPCLASSPGSQSTEREGWVTKYAGRQTRAWYPLSTHALNFFGILSVCYISSGLLHHHQLFIAGRTFLYRLGLGLLAASRVTKVAPLCLNSSTSLTAFSKPSTCLRHFILQTSCGSPSTVDARYFYMEKVLFQFSQSNLLLIIETLLLDEILRQHKSSMVDEYTWHCVDASDCHNNNYMSSIKSQCYLIWKFSSYANSGYRALVCHPPAFLRLRLSLSVLQEPGDKASLCHSWHEQKNTSTTLAARSIRLWLCCKVHACMHWKGYGSWFVCVTVCMFVTMIFLRHLTAKKSHCNKWDHEESERGRENVIRKQLVSWSCLPVCNMSHVYFKLWDTHTCTQTTGNQTCWYEGECPCKWIT